MINNPKLLAVLEKMHKKMVAKAELVLTEARRTVGLRINVIDNTLVGSAGRCYR